MGFFQSSIKFLLTGEINHLGRSYNITPNDWGLIVLFHNYLQFIDPGFDSEQMRDILKLRVQNRVEESEKALLKLPVEQQKLLRNIFAAKITPQIENLSEKMIFARQTEMNEMSPAHWGNKIKTAVFVMHGTNDTMVPFTESILQNVLASVSLTSSVLKGFDKTSYASSRATRSITSHTFKLWRMNLEERFLNRIQFWKSSKFVNLQELPESEQQTNVDWQFVVPPSLDRNADLKADAASLQNGLANLSDVLGEKHGQDWEEKLEQRALEISKAQELAEKHGVPIESLLPNYIERSESVDAET